MEIIAYLDESGAFGNQFEQPGVSRHFIVGGLLFEADKLDSVETLGKQLAKDFFSDGEMKSSGIGNNHQRRIKILEPILRADLNIYAMVFDKTQLTSRGLQFKKSFYKYLSQLAYSILFRSFPNLELYADEHGSKEFMQSFMQYIEKRFIATDLFTPSRFGGFVRSKTSRIIQLADLLVGSVNKIYDPDVPEADRQALLDTFSNSGKLLPIQEWPRRKSFSSHDSNELALNVDNPADEQMLELSLRTANHHIFANRKATTDFGQEQVATLTALLFAVNHGRQAEYISTAELVRGLQIVPGNKVDSKSFGRCVIGPLRDAGVLIASNTKGYKLVASLADIHQFAKYYHSFLGPMLQRLGHYRSLVLTATRNKVDILGDEEHRYLRDIFDKKVS